MLDAADVGKVSIIGLLDLNAAFDTVDHDILIRRLQTLYGVTGRALDWIRSFLSDRTQAVTFRGVTSVEARLTCSVYVPSDQLQQMSSVSLTDEDSTCIHMQMTPNFMSAVRRGMHRHRRLN